MPRETVTPEAGAAESRRRATPPRRQAFVLLRFTLLIATSYMLLAESGFSVLSPFVTVWIAAGLLSNVVATRLPRPLVDSPPFAAVSLVLDTAWITVGLLVTGQFEAEFFFLYFFVLFLAAVGESLKLIALGTVVVSGAYLYALSASGAGTLMDTSTLIRLPFLFAVASFYGYLVDRVRRERDHARTKTEDVARLQEVRERLEATNTRLEEEVSERRKAESALSAANERLTELTEMKSAFVSVVSHELRTPLTSIRNAIDLVRGGTAGDLAPDQRRFLDMAKRNQERLSAIIDDLLDVSRMEAGQLEYRFGEEDAARLVADVRESMEAQALARGVTLEADVAGPLPVWVDPKRLAQVLVNLAGNALKFTPEGGRVVLSARRTGDEIELAVTDTGPGVPEGERERIFEAFYQASSHGQDFLTRQVQGTGLGLSISRELAHAQGGRLRVESAEPPPGSRFVLGLPGDLERARETVDFEEQVRQHRKYPLFGVLAIAWDERDLAPGSPAADPRIRYSALLALRDELRRALPRDCDLLRVEPAHGRIVLVLLATPRGGTEIVRQRLTRRLESIALRIGGETLPVPRLHGPAHTAPPSTPRTGPPAGHWSPAAWRPRPALPNRPTRRTGKPMEERLMTLPTILVADDEPDVLETLRYRLSREGYSVVTATDGVEALGAARAHQPDLALLDVMMPRENGYRVARSLREDESRGVYPGGLKIVLLTARDLSGEPDREEIFLEFSRADLMLYKPFDLEDLVDRVERLLAGDAADGTPAGPAHPMPC